MSEVVVGEDQPETSTEIPEVEPETVTETVSDEDINAAIAAEFAARQAASLPLRQASVQQLFQEGIALVASATGKRHRTSVQVSEATSLKVFELSLMWLINHRGQSMPTFLDSGESVGSEVEEATLDPFIPDEIIGGTAEETPE